MQADGEKRMRWCPRSDRKRHLAHMCTDVTERLCWRTRSEAAIQAGDVGHGYPCSVANTLVTTQRQVPGVNISQSTALSASFSIIAHWGCGMPSWSSITMGQGVSDIHNHGAALHFYLIPSSNHRASPSLTIHSPLSTFILRPNYSLLCSPFRLHRRHSISHYGWQ